MDAALPLPGTTSELLARVPLSRRHPGLQLDKFLSPAAHQEQEKQSLAEVCQATGDSDFLQTLLSRREIFLDSIGAVRWRCATTGPLTLHVARASALANAGICLHPLYGFVYLPGTGLKGMARAYAETVWLPAQYQIDAARQMIEAVFGYGVPSRRPADPRSRYPGAFGRGTPRVTGGKGGSQRRAAKGSHTGPIVPHPDSLPEETAENVRANTIPSTEYSVLSTRGYDSTGLFQRSPEGEGDWFRPHGTDGSPASGSIVFHEAWPETWPKLEVDIVNNHHVKYYQGSDSRDAPGDWESPSMVSFLAIGPGHAFCFALSKRRADVADDLLEHARQWLLGALVHEGAGAKKAAGYGGFMPCEGDPPVLAGPSHEVFETTLELVTPAFLAGANQEADDCRLRAATLRGLLRWWWRTMHAGFVEVAMLRRLETAVWGDVNAGGAVRVTVEPQTPLQPVQYKHRDAEFHRRHQLQDAPRKTSQGLFYASLGMDDSRDRPARWYLAPGTKWTVRLVARRSHWESRDLRGERVRVAIPPAVVLQQAKAALWLLTHLGGAGSKSRKGFGSFADIFAGDVGNLGGCRQAAAAFRLLCRCDGPYQDRHAESLALERARQLDDIPTGWKDHWFALDQLGYAFQSFAQRRRHDRAKAALGLPRQIHGPRREPLPGQDRASHRPPEPLKGPKGDRHASPVFYHLARTSEGALLLRVTIFPARHLPDLLTSTTVLNQLLQHLEGDLRKRAAQPGPGSSPPPAAPVAAPARPAARPAAPPAPPKAGGLVEAVLVEDPKGKGRRFARHRSSGLLGSILNPDKLPADKNLGDVVTLCVAMISSDGQQIQWRVPTEEDKARATAPRGGPPRGPSRRR